MPCAPSVLIVEAALILARQEALRHHREQIDGGGQQQRPTRAIVAARNRSAQRSVQSYSRSQPRTCARSRCRAGRASASCGGLRKRLHSIGVRLIETKPETRIATPIVTANSCSSRPTMPPMKSTGMKTAASDRVIARIVNATSCEPSSAACIARLAHLHVPHDVLEHHDRVVDDEADRERQRHQRQVVEAVAEQVHHREGRDDRDRQREARDDGGRQVPQEQEDHQDDEARSSSSSVSLTSCTDSRIVTRAIAADRRASWRPAAARQRGQQRLDAVDDLRRRCVPGCLWIASVIARSPSEPARRSCRSRRRRRRARPRRAGPDCRSGRRR